MIGSDRPFPDHEMMKQPKSGLTIASRLTALDHGLDPMDWISSHQSAPLVPLRLILGKFLRQFESSVMVRSEMRSLLVRNPCIVTHFRPLGCAGPGYGTTPGVDAGRTRRKWKDWACKRSRKHGEMGKGFSGRCSEPKKTGSGSPDEESSTRWAQCCD